MKEQETRKATGLDQVYQTLVSGNVRYLTLLLLLSLLLPYAAASSLPANVYIQNSTANPSATFPIIVIPSCTANVIKGTCQGNDVISGNHVLMSNLMVMGNIIITSGTLSNGGDAIIATGIFNSVGATLLSSYVAGGLGSNTVVAAPGTSLPASYGGSGGGAGSGGPGGGAGGNTLASGGSSGNPGHAGSQPAAPIVTNANILTWFDGGIQNYFGGAGGGGGTSGSISIPANGGSGCSGFYIQANQIAIGSIHANGTGQVPGTSIGGQGVSGAGGGAGCIALLANGIGTVSVASSNVLGAAGGIGISGDSNGGAGAAGRLITYTYGINAPIPIMPSTVQTYPFLIYTSDQNILYTLNAVSGSSQTTLQGPATALDYVPPSTQPSGEYQYNITESNTVTQISFPFIVATNMTDITSPLTFTGGCSLTIQYYPNCANVPTWNTKPTQWQIQSDVAGNNHTNTTGAINIDQFSNANQTFNLKLRLTYGQFTPSIIFTANVINNPVLSVAITQMPFNVITSNVVPPAPTTREFLNLVTENEQTLAKLNTSTSVSFVALFNNYTINNQTRIIGANTFATYIDNSPFQNPNFYISTLITSSTNASYFPAQNNFCPGFINSSVQQRNLYLYLVSYAVGQATTVDLQSNYGGANNGDFLQVLSGVNPNYATVVQQVLISTQNFLMPLIIGNSYSAIILSGGCKTIYQTPAAAQTNPWNINIVPTLPPPLIVPQVNASCSLSYNITYSANTVTCFGYDNENLVDQWNVSLYNSTGFLGLHLITSNVKNGGTFKWQYYPIYTSWGPLTWRIVWNWGNVDQSGSGSGTLQNIIIAGFNAPFDVFLTVVFLIVGIVIGNATGGGSGGNTHKLSNTMFIEAFLIFFMYMAGISQWLGFPANAALIIFLVVIGLLGSRSEGGVNIGG